jgi:hypothetical protein
MAVKTEIWVKAYLRRCFSAGLTGVVARRGAESAGAVFVKVSRPESRVRLFAPAPGPAYDENGRRRWITPLGPELVSLADADRFLARQVSIDPDIWILDIDDPTGHGLLEGEGRDVLSS